MGSIGQLISASAARGLGLIVKACEPIDPDHFDRFPEARDGTPVRTNHPAFIIGHLSLYPSSALGLVGEDSTQVTPPADWQDLYKAGVECRDGGTTEYHGKPALLEFFTRAHDHTLAALANVSDDVYLTEHPSEATRVHFRTVGIMVNFYFTSHVMLHAGQLSAWRRMMGYGSVM